MVNILAGSGVKESADMTLLLPIRVLESVSTTAVGHGTKLGPARNPSEILTARQYMVHNN